jgi:RNA polymerase subunit RPABC4/transcription elongation factor Spt4
LDHLYPTPPGPDRLPLRLAPSPIYSIFFGRGYSMNGHQCACMACGSMFDEMFTVCPECQSTDLVDAEEFQDLVDGIDGDFGD